MSAHDDYLDPDRHDPALQDDESQHQAMAVLTLRDYFAAKAIGTAFLRLEHNYNSNIGDEWTWEDDDFDALADHAYSIADAMLKARSA